MRRAALLTTMLLLAPLASALTPMAAWVVSSDTTIADMPLAIAQDVVVMPGATLRLENVDALALRDVNVTVLGSLELVEGTRLAAATLPFELWIAPGASLTLAQSTLAGARLATSGTTLLSGASVAASSIDVRGGSASALGTSFDTAPGPALFAHAGTLRVANATIGQTGDYGIRVEGASARIENTTFSLSPSYALYARAAALTLVDSSFASHCGAFVVDATSGTIARNSFETLDHGVTLLDAGAMDVAENAFEGTQVALLVHDSAPDARRNRFADNEVAVQVGFGSSGAPLLRQNAFDGNGVAVDNDAVALTVDAALNWWGAPTGPAAGATQGPVTTAPWLTGAP